MARSLNALTPKRRPAALRLGLLLCGVLLAHALLLLWLAGQQVQPSALRKLGDPMFTRVLAPQAPPPPPETPALTAPPPAPKPPAMTSVAAPSVQPQVTRTAALEPPQPPPQAAEPAPPGARSSEDAATAVNAQTPGAAAPVEAAASAAPFAAEVASEPVSPPPQQVASGTGADPRALDHWPRDSRLSYTLSGQFRGGPLYGSAQVQWQRADATYQTRVTLDISLAGTRVLTSQGEVTPTGLLPRVFEETRGGRRRGVRMGERQIVLDDGRGVARPEGVQDSASQFVELGYRFASGRDRLEVGRTVDVWLARPGGVDLWTYDVVEREMLRTPGHGDVQAWRLRPRPIDKARGNITAEIWFAPALQYLPVRIRVSMGDEAFVDLRVETIEQR
ncbi:MAG: DUF3108 domain-containing protein [Pseudomonadota bacterium]